MAEGENVFKLFVYFIIVAIVLFMAYAYLLPFINPPADLSKELSKGIELAQANEGKVSEEKSVFLKATQVVFAKNLEDATTLAVLECTDQALCCTDEENCSNSLSFDSKAKSIKVQKDTAVNVFYRCLFEHRLFVCKAFFGKKPAQLEIKELKTPESIDLSQNSNLSIQLTVQNSGDIPTTEGFSATVQVFNALDSSPSRQALAEAVKDFGKLNAGEKKTESITVKLNSPGKLEVKAIVASEEAGTDSKTAIVQASGIPATECTALSKESAEIYPTEGSISELRGKCVAKANCEKCPTAFECKNAWTATGENAVSAASDYAYVIENENSC